MLRSSISLTWRVCKVSFKTLLAVDTAHTTYYLHQLAITDKKDKGHIEVLYQLKRSILVLPFLNGFHEGRAHAVNATPKRSESKYKLSNKEISSQRNETSLM